MACYKAPEEFQACRQLSDAQSHSQDLHMPGTHISERYHMHFVSLA